MTTPVSHFEGLLPTMLQDARSLIERESPSADLDAVASSAEEVLSQGERVLGVPGERILVDGCTHVRWCLGDGSGDRVLVLGHHDTVWPHGSLVRHPFTAEQGILRGPGSFDMKVGLVMTFHAVASLPPGLGVTILITGDEEIGSRSSRSLIESTASECKAVFVLEAAADGGALKTARKGMADYRLTVTGAPAHAGLEPEKGINSTVEISHQVLRIAALASEELGTSVVTTVLSAGTTTNTVPATAHVAVDVRAWTQAEQLRVDRAIRALEPVLPGATLSVSGGLNRAPLEHDMSAALFETACTVARDLGLDELHEAHVGGGSDGNFTAGMGIPTLDGLGAVGGGAHADSEHVIVAELPKRTALLAGLIEHVLLPASSTNGAVLNGQIRR